MELSYSKCIVSLNNDVEDKIQGIFPLFTIWAAMMTLVMGKELSPSIT